MVRAVALRPPRGSAERILARLDQLTRPTALATVLALLRDVIRQLTATIRAADAALETRAGRERDAQHPTTARRDDTIIALTFPAMLARPHGSVARPPRRHVSRPPADGNALSRACPSRVDRESRPTRLRRGHRCKRARASGGARARRAPRRRSGGIVLKRLARVRCRRGAGRLGS